MPNESGQDGSLGAVMRVKAGLPDDLTISPSDLELAHQTFNEMGIYEAMSEMAVEVSDLIGRPLDVLDVCSATGLAAKHVGGRVPVRSMTLIDTDLGSLRLARARLEDRWSELRVLQIDALDFSSVKSFDLILANSAYHHIEDHKKPTFLRKLSTFLRDDGRILMGEHFLPTYGPGPEELCRALWAFYVPLLSELQRRQTPDDAIRVISKAFELGLRQEIEFKVSWDRFLTDVRLAGLSIDRTIQVWGPGQPKCGSMAVQLKAGLGLR